MVDGALLRELLEADYEDEAIAALLKRGLFEEANSKRWVAPCGTALPLGPRAASLRKALRTAPVFR